MSRYRLAFIDLDDTLLGPTKAISPENLAALDRLRREGITVAIASGRHHRNITGIAAIGSQDWVLSSHGGVVRHEQTGEILVETTLPAEIAHELCERGRAEGFGLLVYHREGAYMERSTEWIELYARNAGWRPIVADFATLPEAGFQKVIWTERPARVDEWVASVKSEYGHRLNVLVTNPELLEFFPTNADKVHGAQALAAHLGVTPEETLAFGDGHNDVEMLRWAHGSVAMDHGREAARAAARHISPAGPPESAFARAVALVLG